MSYLMLDKGVPDFSKAVISFWFRVPQESLDKARMNFDSSKLLSLKNGIIPLVVMGKPGTGQVPYKRKYQSSDQSTWDQLLWLNLFGNYIAGPWEPNGLNLDCSWQPLPDNPYPTYHPNNPLVVTEPAPQTDPTYIGVDYSGNLYVSFQTAQTPDTVGWLWYVDSVTPGEEVNAISDLGGTPQYDGDTILGSGGSGPNDPFIYYSEQFYFFKNRVKTYAPGGHNIVLPKEHWVDLNGVGTGIIGNNGAQQITADKWHHVLISVDLVTISSRGAVDNLEPIPPSVPLSNFVSGASKLYIAVDDVNYTQWDLSSWWVWGAGDNDVISKEAVDTAGGLPATDDRGNFLPTSTYTLTNPTVPTSDQAIGIPATSEFVDSIYKVEMAEFLMWTGVTLDTSKEENRRLFIAPDKKGVLRPINSTPIYIPITKTAVGDPPTWDWDSAPDTPAFVPPLSSLDPSVIPSAVKFPGNDKPTAADIDFTRCCINWQMGRNLGKLKSKVVKTGKIKAYSPDPSIGGEAS